MDHRKSFFLVWFPKFERRFFRNCGSCVNVSYRPIRKNTVYSNLIYGFGLTRYAKIWHWLKPINRKYLSEI